MPNAFQQYFKGCLSVRLCGGMSLETFGQPRCQCKSVPKCEILQENLTFLGITFQHLFQQRLDILDRSPLQFRVRHPRVRQPGLQHSRAHRIHYRRWTAWFIHNSAFYFWEDCTNVSVEGVAHGRDVAASFARKEEGKGCVDAGYIIPLV